MTTTILWALTAALVIAGQILAAAARWQARQSSLYVTDFDEACIRAKNPPWYVRLVNRLPGG